MATIEPFAALRPKPDLAARICELPYDVMSSAEARQIASGNPLSFLHISKPEIDLPPDTDPYSAPVYARARQNLDRLVAEGALRQGDVGLNALPMFHIAAILLLNAQWSVGATLIVLPNFDPVSWLSAIQSHRISAAALVPMMVL